ncbi:glycosyltransferase family 25 protein, partial [Leptolyngbya sp. FACHB-36]|uniref:glycosyltransferase family 25 protein n=1 Tax=Leptolyngbya sp. FACHB-36 TaxID=2692808 RepID=UPI001681B74D
MKITEFFDRTFVVNLPERVDRRKDMVRELENAGMPLTPQSVEIFPAIRPETLDGFPSFGARGCFLSHLKILRQAKADGLNSVLVMEDDLTISEQFSATSANWMRQLQQTEWGFVYFGHIESVADATEPLTPFVGPLATTHFYAVHHRVLDRLIDFLELVQSRPPGHPDGGPMHLDGAFTTFRQQNPDVLTLIAAPNLGWQRSS